MRFKDELRNWAEGVITSIEADELPKTAASAGLNSAFFKRGTGKAVLGKREGFATINRTPVTSSPAIIGQHEYRKRSGSGFTNTHLLVSNGGRLDSLATDGTLTTISASAFTAGDLFPDFATAKDLEFIVNGTDKKKYDGNALTAFGITRPSAPTIAAGAAGDPSGDYEVALTYFNEDTGHESSRSDADTITVASESIDVTLPTVGLDSQITHIRVHIRKIGLQSNFFRVTSGTNYDSDGGGWEVGETTVNIDLTDADLNNLIIVSPSTSENDPPPAGVDKIAWYGNRLFVADQQNVYWSGDNKPESFRPLVDFEPVSTDEGLRLTALHVAHEVLLVFANNALYVLRGFDPVSWEWDVVIPDIGNVNPRAIITVNGLTFWWSDTHGAMMWNGGGPPLTIAKEFIAEDIDEDDINKAQLDLVCVGLDENNDRVVFALPETGQTRNTMMIPFNYQLKRFESTYWDPIDAASMGRARNADTGKIDLFIGGYAGQVFRYGNTDNDGIAEGTHSGTFVAADVTQSEFTGCLDLEGDAAVFDTTGGGLIERKVTIVDSSGMRVGRYRLTANTATGFTTATAVTGLVTSNTYTFYIGGPDFSLSSRCEDSDDPFTKKEYQYFFVHARTPGGSSVTVGLELTFDGTEQSAVAVGIVGATGSVWDELVWDEAVWDGAEADVTARVRVGKVGKKWTARFYNFKPNSPLLITKMRMDGKVRNSRY